MAPLRSLSKASQAPATSFVKFSCLAATRNSYQLQLLELSLSITCRQARNKWPYFSLSKRRSWSAASALGSATRYAGGFHRSRKSRSSNTSAFFSCQSNQCVISQSCCSWKSTPRRLHSLLKVSCESRYFPRRSTAFQRACAGFGPNVTSAQRRNFASCCAQRGSSSCKEQVPAPSVSRACHSKRTSPFHPRLRQTLNSSARWRFMVPSASKARRQA
mmetsp:Transcript_8046/g.18800  ORF Transcript_8046/g.18800 Transcript_8046/m.18800 type:complete len:217 (-) Transcript_8046:831-1481(-)